MLNQLLNIYELKLLIGLDIVQLGESRQAVISRLGEPKRSTDEDDTYKRDSYSDRGLYLEYDYDMLKCVSIEVFPPAKVMYGGVDLLSLKYDEALRWVRGLDSNVEEDDDGVYGDGFKSYLTQISMGTKLYAEGKIETLFIFSAGYWPSAEERKAASERRVEAIIAKYKPGEAEAELERMMNGVFD